PALTQLWALPFVVALGHPQSYAICRNPDTFMAYTTLSLEYEAELAILTLNRPERGNAISPEMITELILALDEIEKSQVRVAIVAGAGKAFCSGMDLEALRELT